MIIAIWIHHIRISEDVAKVTFAKSVEKEFVFHTAQMENHAVCLQRATKVLAQIPIFPSVEPGL